MLVNKAKNKINSYFINFTKIERQNAIKISLFNSVFYAVMFSSSTIFILYLKNLGLVSYISVYYTIMSVIGMGALFYSNIYKYFKSKNIIIFGILLYMMGLFLRSYPQNYYILITSSVLCAVGVNLVLLGSRMWFLYFTNTQNQSKVIGLSGISQDISKQSLLFLAVFLILISYQFTLIFLSLILLISLFFVPSIPYMQKSKEISKYSNKLSIYLITLLSLQNIIAGFISFLTFSMFVLFLSYKNLADIYIPTFISITSIFASIFAFYFANKIKDSNLRLFYIMYTIAISLLILILLYNQFIGILALLCIFTLKILSASFGISFNIVDNKIAQHYNPIFLLTLMQSTVLAGTTLGGLTSNYFLSNNIALFIILTIVIVYFIVNWLVLKIYNNLLQSIKPIS